MERGSRAVLGAATGACSPGSSDGGGNGSFLFWWPGVADATGQRRRLFEGGCLGFLLVGLDPFIWSLLGLG